MQSVHAKLSREELEERRIEFERALIDADRMLMQIVQLALSMIGFGFSITTFFHDVAGRIGVRGDGQGARLMGASLLVIGVVLLSSGIWSQSRYRRELRRRYARNGLGAEAWSGLMNRFTPSYVSAILLLLAGAVALGSVVLRWLL